MFLFLLQNACIQMHSMGNKQKQPDIWVHSQSNDLLVITEIWWGRSHNWNTVVDGCVLWRKDRPARWVGGVALHVREQHECIELCLEMNDEWVESFCVLRGRLIWVTLLWHVQSRIFLQCIENRFLMRMMENPVRSVLLHLVLIKKKKKVWLVMWKLGAA